jgi:outer membrane protein OmpA-like peptidoglycan-associated protein
LIARQPLLVVGLAAASFLATTSSYARQSDFSRVVFFPSELEIIDRRQLDDLLRTLSRFKNQDERCHTIDLSGHVDSAEAKRRSGLDERRTKFILNFLAGEGFHATQIKIKLHGDRMPLVLATEGVAETSNRRVEIYLHPEASVQ